MNQEILFLLFMLFELCAIVSIYTFWIIPRIAEKTNNIFEERMLDKTWDIPAMLEDYTVHLTEVFSEVIKKLVPSILGGYMSGATRQLKADPENVTALATAEFLDELPLPMKLLANKLMPRLQDALDKVDTKQEEPVVKFTRGLTKP